MHTEFLYKLKEKLLEELEKYSKGELSSSSLQYVDTLSHAAKNVCKLIEASEMVDYSGADGGSYEGESYRGSYARGMSRRGGSYPMSRADGGSSYRRRRDSMGRYSREGGYSRNDEMISELREMMEGAPDDRTREEFQRLISKMEQM